MAKLLQQRATLPDLATTTVRLHSLSQSQLAGLSFVASTPSLSRSALAPVDATLRHPATQPVWKRRPARANRSPGELSTRRRLNFSCRLLSYVNAMPS